METFCIAVGIVGLMTFAYRGWSIILIAPFFAVLTAILSEFSILPVYSELYMTRLAEYTKTYYPIFLFGAVFARLMEKGGLASAIAEKIISLLGETRAIAAVLLGCAALTYGGLSVFVVAFVMYPFGAEIFRKADIPKKLLPATLWMGIFSFAMVALPGTPQIQNIIPSSYFGTSTWAGAGIGLFATILFIAAAYIGRRRYMRGKENFLQTINFGAASSCAAVLNVASGFAFGSVIISMPGFLPVKEILLGIADSAGPLVSAVVTTNIMCGLTGSASGGLTIALSLLGDQWAQMAQAQGIPLDALHRITSIASVGIDPVPHCGALVTLLAICGLTHKEAYFDIVILMVLKFFVPFLCVLFYMLTGIS